MTILEVFLSPYSVTLSIGIIILGLIYRWREITEFIDVWRFARSLPGPHFLTFLFFDTNETANLFMKWSQEISKTYRICLGPITKIIITDPRDIEILLASPFAEEKDILYDFMRSLVSNSMINSKGATYRSHKKLFMPLANGKPLSTYVKDGNKFSRRFVELLNEKVDKGEFDMHHDLAPCVCDLVFETLFGVPGRAQYGRPTIFTYGIEKLLHILHKRMIQIWLYPNFMFKMSKIGKLWFSIGAEASEFLYNIIAEKKMNYLESKNLGTEREVPITLCDQLIDRIMKTNSWTDLELHDELFTIFIGSHDTMVGVGSFTFLMLAMHPEIQDKVREEIKLIAGDEIMTDEMVAQMKYTDMVIRETIRIFPAGPFLPRKITGELKLATCTLPKGCSAMVVPYAVHRDPDYWSEPDKFNPENHSVENSKNRHPSAFLPFSGGIRTCPGYKYAMALLKVIIADVVRNYNLSTTMTMKTIKLNAHISVRSRNGINLSITKLKV